MNKITTFISAMLLMSTTAFATANESKLQTTASEENVALPRGLAKLNLSPAQTTKILALIKQAHSEKMERPDRSQLEQKIQQRRQQERQLMIKSQFDDQAACKMLSQLKTEREKIEQQYQERELALLKLRHAIFQILTPEQQKQFLADQDKFETRKMNHFP